jgi:hypothetical protein
MKTKYYDPAGPRFRIHTIPKWTELFLYYWWKLDNSGANEIWDSDEIHCMEVADFVVRSRGAEKGPCFYLADLAKRWKGARTEEQMDSVAGYLMAETDLGLLESASMHEMLLLLPNELRQRADEITACRSVAFADRG